MTPDPNIERLARQFHQAYERLAPSFGYETRRESAVPWDQVPEQNRALMMAVVSEVLAAVSADLERADRLRDDYSRLVHDAARCAADLEAARADLSKSKALLRDGVSQVIQMKRDLEAARAALRDVKAWLQQEEEVGLGVPDILWDVILAALAAPDPEGDDRG